MRKQATHEPSLVDKIHRLPPEKVDEGADGDDRLSSGAASRLSEKAFRKVWDNPDDAAYDHP